jgi:hypothetical protein
MALKFGRTAGITSRIDPQGNVRYREEEYEAYQSAVAAEQERKKAYDASMAKFKADSDVYYGRNINDTQKSEEASAVVNMAGNKDRQGRTVTGEVAKPRTQAQSDKLFDEQRRKGETISINDPSVTAKTRSMLKEAYYGTDISNADIRKGKNYTKWSELYGEDFDPVQWRKDSKAGKNDKYAGRSYSIVEDATLGIRGVTPVKPAAYVPANLGKEIKAKDTDFYNWGDKMPTLKVKLGEGELIKPKKVKVKEKEEFVSPEKIMEVNKKVSMNPLAGGATSQGSGKRYLGQVGGAIGSRVKNAFSNPNRRYDKEQKGFKGLYGGGETLGDKSFSEMSLGEMKDYKKDIKGASRRGIYDRFETKAAVGELKAGMRFRKDEEKGKNIFFKSDMGKEYMESSTYDTDRKLALDNATNRNTIANQQAKLATNTVTPSYKSQMRTQIATDNPTATKREVRKLAQTKQQTDEATMRAVEENMKAKGMIKK